MEQQPPAPRTPSPTPSQLANDPTTSSLDSATTPRPTSQETLSTSEPSLCFPRPQGSSHLANWITTSDPDIMRLTTTTEDTGLSESTYELISGTDSESQDGAYAESVGESVSDVDMQRPDDAYSLASTEQTCDDEFIIDEPEVFVQSTSGSQDEANDDTITDAMLEPQYNDDDDTVSCSEDEARSRPSLEYTQQSLGTPSMTTPEASKIVERPTEPAALAEGSGHDAGTLRARINKRLSGFWAWEAQFKDSVVSIGAAALPGLVFISLVALLLPVMFSIPPKEAPHIPTSGSILTSVTTPPLVPSATGTTSVQRAASTQGVSLIPLEGVFSTDWAFGGKKPNLTVAKQDGNFVVHIPADIKEKWLHKHCLDLSAKRDDGTVVRMSASSVDEGMLLGFPKEDSHGVVMVDISATCRPKVKKVLKITFAKGVMGEVIDRTKNFATDIVPAAAQEAERCLGDARRSLGSASDNILSASNGLFQDFTSRFNEFHRSLGCMKSGVRDMVQSSIDEAREKTNTSPRVAIAIAKIRMAGTQAQLNLLEAQLSAKTAWLKVTGQKEEHERYSRKAKEFMATKLGELLNSPSKPQRREWPKVFRVNGCGNKRSHGMRNTEQCHYVA